MKFIEYSCYYLYKYFIRRGKHHDTAKVAAVGYVMVSLFFFFISPLLFLRFINLNIGDKYEHITKSFFGFIALLFYIYLCYKIEQESKFVKIIEKYDSESNSTYSRLAVLSFVLGGIICFCLSFVVIAVISR